MRNFLEALRRGLGDPWIRGYLRALAVLAVLGALSHLASMLGLQGEPWVRKSLPVRVADVVLLAANLLIGWGLWRTKVWGVVVWLAALLTLQFIPLLFFARYFLHTAQEQVGARILVSVDAALVLIFVLLLLWRGRVPLDFDGLRRP